MSKTEKVTPAKIERARAAETELAAARAALPSDLLAELDLAATKRKAGSYLAILEGCYRTPESVRFYAARRERKLARKAAALGTRRRFPAKVADLLTRWCSSYLKIMVADSLLRTSPRFVGKRTIVLTGERAEESKQRSGYATFEPNRADLRNGKRTPRVVDHWRPVHSWTNDEVWARIEAAGINPHPAYRLGFGRTSCQFCIFIGANEWATNRAISPERFERIAELEAEFGWTIDGKGESVRELADRGRVLSFDQAVADEANDPTWDGPIFLESWTRPAGADGDQSCGAPP